MKAACLRSSPVLVITTLCVMGCAVAPVEPQATTRPADTVALTVQRTGITLTLVLPATPQNAAEAVAQLELRNHSAQPVDTTDWSKKIGLVVTTGHRKPVKVRARGEPFLTAPFEQTLARLAPGESRRVTVELSEWFELENGEYELSVSQPFSAADQSFGGILAIRCVPLWIGKRPPVWPVPD